MNAIVDPFPARCVAVVRGGLRYRRLWLDACGHRQPRLAHRPQHLPHLQARFLLVAHDAARAVGQPHRRAHVLHLALTGIAHTSPAARTSTRTTGQSSANSPWERAWMRTLRNRAAPGLFHSSSGLPMAPRTPTCAQQVRRAMEPRVTFGAQDRLPTGPNQWFATVRRSAGRSRRARSHVPL